MPATDDLQPRRRADRGAIEAAREQGRKDAEHEAFVTATRQHFAAINGSIERTGTALGVLGDEVRQIKEQQARRDLVNEALVKAAAGREARRFTRWQKMAGVLALAAGYGGIIATILAQ